MTTNSCTTPLYQPVDIVVRSTAAPGNPFFTELHGVFSGPGGSYEIPGFYDGNNTWKVRFSPTALGTWTYTLVSPHVSLSEESGQVTCVPNTNPNVHGGLVINPQYPYHFQYQDGTPCFMFTYEADWLWALALDDPELTKLRELVTLIRKYGFNQILTQIYGHYYSTCRHKDGSMDYDYGPPALYAWEGDNEHPDHEHMNVAFFQSYDQVMQVLLDAGITVNLMLKVYNKHVEWPEKYSLGDDLYFKYITARYQAFPNVVWNHAKETYYELDKDYVASRLAIVRANDSYRRLMTMHDDRLFYKDERNGHYLDFATLQQHDDFYTSILLEREYRRWPVFNSEFGYESGPGGLEDYFAWGNNTTEDYIDRAYKIVMAGGYVGYYYNYTAWNIIDYRHIPKGYTLFKILHDFFTSIEWWKFEPRRDYVRNDRTLCLARGHDEFVMYARAGGSAELPDGIIPESFAAEWMNTFTGEHVPARGVRTSEHDFTQERWVFKSPFVDAPAVLHIKRKS